MKPLLQIENLRVSYAARAGMVCPALAGVDFELASGEILGVLGESGSGKSTLAAALLSLLPANGKIEGGRVFFEGKDLLQASKSELRRVRGGRVGLIFQEPSSSLHPTMRVGRQVSDVLAAHARLERAALRVKTLEVLETVFGVDAGRISRAYPHELSGGQRQRVLIAQAIACEPALLIADEPTASLDPTTQREILQLFRTIREKLSVAIILITHNPLLLDGLADRVLVLYAGRVAEIGPAEQVLGAPKHPYTAALLRCLPAVSQQSVHDLHLQVILGEPLDLSAHAAGCRFEPRCGERMKLCGENEPEAVAVGGGHGVSCFKFTA
jgi:oligopeptide/dipeptide ABC transporter ATP-binding protein